MMCSPDEILRMLLDERKRQEWDYNVKKVEINR